MTDRTALIAQLAWNRQTAFAVAGHDSGVLEGYVNEAKIFVELVERLTRPEPRQCQALQPFTGEEFRGVCDLPHGHSGKHMDGGFIW